MSWFGVPPEGLDMYHVGVVVPDVREAMRRYSEAMGFTWTPVGDTTVDVLVDGLRREARIAATYSRQGPPYLELIEELAGGVWAADGLALQHVGFWADDLEGSVHRLNAAGFLGRVRHSAPEGEDLFSYHQAGPNLWWELVNTRFRSHLDARLATPRETGS